MSQAKDVHHDATCRTCQRPYRYRGTEPACCGALPCRARTNWGPDEWAGRARMANARQLAGTDLNDLDREALRRAT